MTIINPNSISGITSVTAQAGVMNFYKSDGTLAGLQLNGVNFNTTSGISTFNDVYVGGTITYEDVKNVDSVGIVTARAGVKVNVDGSASSNYISIGAGDDLKLFHDGSHSKLKNSTGFLVLESDSFALNNGAGSENIIKGFNGGAVELYHNNSKKLETTSSGATVTGDITISDKIIHAGDTNTAIRFPAADTVSVETAGQQNVQVTGTRTLLKSPSGTDTTVRLQHQGNSGYGDIILDRQVNAFIISNDPSNASNNASYFSVKNKGNTNLYVKNDGKIGINTTTPYTALELQGDGGVNDATITFTRHGSPANGSVIGSNFYRIGTDSVAGIGAYRESAMDDAYLAFHTQPTGGNYTERLRITSGGKVNIGGDYTQTSRFVNINGGSTVGQLQIKGTEADLWLHSTGANGQWRILGSSGNNTHAFRIYDQTNSAERLRIDSSGNALFDTTNTNPTANNADGTAILTGGGIRVSKDGEPLGLNRGGSDGIFIDMRRDGTSKATMGVTSNALQFSTAGGERLRITSAGRLGLGYNNPDETNGGAGFITRATPVTRTQYYSPAGQYAGSFGLVSNTNTKMWIAVESSYAQGSAVSAGILLRAHHQDAGGSDCGYTIKNLRTGNALAFSRVKTAANTGSAAIEEERLRIDSSGRVLIGTTVLGSTSADVLTVSASGNAGITVRSGTSNSGNLFFSDGNSGNSNFRGYVQYLHASNDLLFGTNAVERLRIKSDGDVNVLTGHLQAQDLKLGLLADRYPIIQRAIASSGSQSLSITGGSGYSEHTGSAQTPTDAKQGALISLKAGNPTSDTFGGGITYYANGHTSPNNPGSGNQHVFYTRSGVDTYAERVRFNHNGGIKISNVSSGHLIDFGSSTTKPNAAVDIYRMGNGFADIRLSSNYGASLFLAGASNNSDELMIHQDNLKNAYISNEANNPLIFGTNNTYHMRILASGLMLIGKTSSAVNSTGVELSPNGNNMFTRNGNTVATFNRGTNNGVLVSLQRSGNEGGTINITPSSCSYNSASDYRLKENEVAISDGIRRLKALKPYRFNFKADPSTDVDGFFAHEVQSVVPQAVTGTKDEVATEEVDGKSIGDPIYQGMDHAKLVPLLTAALQEAITKIEVLETEVAALKSS